jgi:hypothetical protein
MASSWTPDHKTAADFAKEYKSYNDDRPGQVVSAWIPEDAIRLMPMMWGDVRPKEKFGEKARGGNVHSEEQEVVVNPHHGGVTAHPSEVLGVTKPYLSLDERISARGKYPRSQARPKFAAKDMGRAVVGGSGTPATQLGLPGTRTREQVAGVTRTFKLSERLPRLRGR